MVGGVLCFLFSFLGLGGAVEILEELSLGRLVRVLVLLCSGVLFVGVAVVKQVAEASSFALLGITRQTSLGSNLHDIVSIAIAALQIEHVEVVRTGLSAGVFILSSGCSLDVRRLLLRTPELLSLLRRVFHSGLLGFTKILEELLVLLLQLEFELLFDSFLFVLVQLGDAFGARLQHQGLAG